MSYWERGTISAGTRTDSTTRLRTKSARAIQGELNIYYLNMELGK